MKKFLSFMVMAIALVLPVAVNADVAISKEANCDAPAVDGIKTCTLVLNDTTEGGSDNITIKLTELGGADIISIDSAVDTEWSVSSKTENNGVWTVLLTSPGIMGENALFTFKYKESGTANCKVTYGTGEKELGSTTPSTNITPDTNTTPDQKEENKDTGATLPYIALGAVVLVATGAYIATKNKSKMYKI